MINNKWLYATRLVMALIVAVAILYDVFAALFGGMGATISSQFYYLSTHLKVGLVFPFALGYLCGHLTAPVE